MIYKKLVYLGSSQASSMPLSEKQCDGEIVMRRAKKAFLLTVRKMAHRLNRPRLYYWSETKLNDLGSVTVMPEFYYRWLFTLCMRMAESKRLKGLADRVIHSIPFHVRFRVV